MRPEGTGAGCDRRRPSRGALARLTAALSTGLALLFAAWTFGATESWALRGSAALAVFAALATLLANAVGGSGEARAADRRAGVALWGAAGALGLYILAQAANPSHEWSHREQALVPRHHVRWLPGTVDRAASVGALLRFGLCAVVFGCAARTMGRGERAALLGLSVAGASVMAVVACSQAATPDPWGRRPLTGLFVNPNHYAAFANAHIPIALALAWGARQRARERGRLSHPGYLLYVAAGVLALSVFTSKSKAGIAVCLLQLAAWAALEWREGCRGAAGARADRPRWRRAAPAAALMALAALGAAVLVRVFQGEHGELSYAAERLRLYGAVLRGVGDRFLFGTGAGTFSLAFPYYQPVEMTGFYRHAHCDWLQYLLELGVVGSALAGYLAGRVGRDMVRPFAASAREGRGSETIVQGRACVIGLGGLCLHAGVDFPLHIPAIALLAAALAGCLRSVRLSAARRSGEGFPDQQFAS